MKNKILVSVSTLLILGTGAFAAEGEQVQTEVQNQVQNLKEHVKEVIQQEQLLVKKKQCQN